MSNWGDTEGGYWAKRRRKGAPFRFALGLVLDQPVSLRVEAVPTPKWGWEGDFSLKFFAPSPSSEDREETNPVLTWLDPPLEWEHDFLR